MQMNLARNDFIKNEVNIKIVLETHLLRNNPISSSAAYKSVCRYSIMKRNKDVDNAAIIMKSRWERVKY